MKIEVTFDRNAKKAFKEECVKRLRQFVEQMKRQPTLREHFAPNPITGSAASPS